MEVSKELPCESVKSYSVEKYSTESGWVSDDELDVILGEELELRYG
jgi:hypothetical protein